MGVALLGAVALAGCGGTHGRATSATAPDKTPPVHQVQQPPHRVSMIPLAQLKVPVGPLERRWRKGIQTVHISYDGYTQIREDELIRAVTAVVHTYGAKALRIKVWLKNGGLELVLASRLNPGKPRWDYFDSALSGVLDEFVVDNSFVKVVDPTGSSVYEWALLPTYGMPGYERMPCRIQWLRYRLAVKTFNPRGYGMFPQSPSCGHRRFGDPDPVWRLVEKK